VPFRDFGVDEVICTALDDAGIHTTFPIQALTLPLAMAGQDIIGQARTGTGKTLAFGVPMLQQLVTTLAGSRETKPPVGLVIVPTRELAVQVAEDLKQAGARLGTRVLTIYGGRAYEPQIEALTAGVDIVVGTPGRLLDLANRKNLDLGHVRSLVLDEADKMLDLGFLPDVERLLRQTPDGRQTMLFSATMPGEVVTLARRHMHQPTNIRAEEPEELAPPPLTTQHAFRTHHLDKIEVLARVLQAKDRGLAMVFCQTKRAADQVSTALEGRGFAVATVHGDLGQSQRERALRAFRGGKVDVLVATDVAARGIDVDDVTHVVNYECPDDEKTYLHRIGRTGRAGRAGVAVTFVDWRDMQRWKLIDTALSVGIPEPTETYSTSEHLFTDLSIPPGTTGRLPRDQRGIRAGLAAEEEEDLGETGASRSRRIEASGGGRPRNRSRSRKDGDSPARAGAGRDSVSRDGAPRDGASRDGAPRDGAALAAARAADEAGDAAPRARRRRRRTRGGSDVASGNGGAAGASGTGAAATQATGPESTPQAS
jgi:superfamily II DNA/RNA helicase